ncbi:MAG: family 78 glycoside hydrolase catalytic domain [Oscillospiraceae bacterium]|nr:family 78 glycoside hydrolase catalytic domain [Oscillospiraceae bacterium]
MFNNAKWIWHNDYHIINTYLNFFDEIFIDNLCEDINIYISADMQYAVHINDVFVNSGQYADFPEYKVYDEVNINKYLHTGSNNLMITGYWQGEDSFQYRKEPAGLIFIVKSNDKIILTSSENTMTALNSAYTNGVIERVSGQLSFSFRYNCLKADEKIGLKNADVQDKSLVLYPRPIKKLDILDDIPTVLTVHGDFTDLYPVDADMGLRVQYSSLAIKEPIYNRKLPSAEGIQLNDSFAIIDIGSENTGFLKLDIELPQDCEILLAWGEHLEDLRVRASVGGRCFTASYYGKAGRNKFMHPFKRAGLRYLQIHVYAPSFKLYYAGIQPTLYPLHMNLFKCADHLHNKIYEASLRTLHMCMHEHYEDCPWREQALYSMDSRNQMLCGYYTFNEYKFARASLHLFALSIREDGLLDICSPARCPFTIPSFTAIYLTQLSEYLEFSKDIDFIREVLDVAKKVADQFVSRINDTGLIPRLPTPEYWNFYEWQDGLTGYMNGPKTDKIIYDAPLNAIVSMGLRSMAFMCKSCGDTETADYYFGMHRKLNAAMDKIYWNGEKGAYASFYEPDVGISHYCEFVQSVIIYADACDDAKLDVVLEHLTDGSLIPVTISHSIFKYDALMKRPEKYARFVFNQVAEFWSYMLYNGATTFWETIDGAAAFGNAGSLCHGWSAVPACLYLKYAMNLPSEMTGLYECQFNQ